MQNDNSKVCQYCWQQQQWPATPIYATYTHSLRMTAAACWQHSMAYIPAISTCLQGTPKAPMQSLQKDA